MTIDAFAKQNCSIAKALSFLGERWTLLVLRELFLGQRRFDRIQAELGIASNVLSERLATLVAEGIVSRHRYSDHPERHEYRLTDKGRELQPLLLELMKWGDRHTASHGAPRVIVHRDCGHAIGPVQTCSHCGGELTAGNVRMELGPGATEEDRAAEERRRAAA